LSATIDDQQVFAWKLPTDNQDYVIDGQDGANVAIEVFIKYCSCRLDGDNLNVTSSLFYNSAAETYFSL